jgi:hypothetical protein
MDEKAEKFYAKVEKYGGCQVVPAERIHAIFEEILRPGEMGFALAKKGFWARRTDEDITSVIKLEKLKGGAYGMAYGVSLSYVPYPYVPKLKWHKTLKSVWLDLSERPQVHLFGKDSADKDSDRYEASGLLGERCFREDMTRVWKLSSAYIYSWFEETRTLEGVLKKCREHLDRERPGMIRYVPGARLVRAFTLARAGRADEAKAELEIFLREHQEGDLARANLTAALEQIKTRRS